MFRIATRHIFRDTVHSPGDRHSYRRPDNAESNGTRGYRNDDRKRMKIDGLAHDERLLDVAVE